MEEPLRRLFGALSVLNLSAIAAEIYTFLRPLRRFRKCAGFQFDSDYSGERRTIDSFFQGKCWIPQAEKYGILLTDLTGGSAFQSLSAHSRHSLHSSLRWWQTLETYPDRPSSTHYPRSLRDEPSARRFY